MLIIDEPDIIRVTMGNFPAETIEIFKQEVVRQNKSATIVEQEDGSVKMTIHGGEQFKIK